MTKKPNFGSRTAIGSLTQLAAVGPQDVHLHYGEDAASFLFQQTYSQHTRFGIDVTSVYDIESSFGSTLKFSVPFEKQHLISNITLRLELPEICKHVPETCTDIVYRNNLGYRLIKHVYVKLNNTIIERYTGQYMYVLHQLETSSGHKSGLESMMGVHNCEDCLSGNRQILHIPLILWYSRTMKQFFPQLALSNEKVNIEIEFETLENLVQYINDETPVQVQLVPQPNDKVKVRCTESNYVENVSRKLPGQFYIDYIALDNTERDHYLKTDQLHVYNLTLMQTEIIKTTNAKIDLHFNIPIKQLLFVLYKDNDKFDFLTFQKARLLFGKVGNDSMNMLSSDYFSMIQSYYHNKASNNGHIYTYSFALNSGYTEHNGAVHFGKLPTKILEITGTNASVTQPFNIAIYARGYNILYTNQGYGKIEFKA